MFAIGAVALAACTGDDFDATQVPQITITPVVAAPLVTIRWTPANAQQILVYKGTVADGNSTNVVWSIAASSVNSLTSPIEYGTNPPPGGTTVVAAKRLESGQPYTVLIGRVDPADASGGVLGNRFRYTATQTFTLATSPP